jgi:hypothetical protein
VAGMFFDNRREEVRVKIVRAYGECPGIRERRRTQQAAKSHGDLRARVDPWISEWGNPAGVTSGNRTVNT